MLRSDSAPGGVVRAPGESAQNNATPCLAMTVMRQIIPVDVTILCIDIPDKILIDGRKPNRQHPLHRSQWYRGIQAHQRADRRRKRDSSPPPQALVTQASVSRHDFT